MPLHLNNPQATIAEIISFLRTTFQEQTKQSAVIAVSGGIDSALSLTLLAQALPATRIFPMLLPYADQSIEDSQTICEWNNIPPENVETINIEPTVTSAAHSLSLVGEDTFRLGQIMARARMIMVYDRAKNLDALVCGTENKSEKYLGYFTRFGDEASDIEPLQHLYKTQVRQLAEYLGLPEVFTQKAPSAELWAGQTDETELGFSYDVADQVLSQYVDEKREPDQILLPEGSDPLVIQKVIDRVKSQQFKREVPYVLKN